MRHYYKWTFKKNSTSKIGALIRIKSSFFKYGVFMIHIRINVKIEERCPAHLSSQHSAAHFSRPLLLEMEDRQTTGAICFPQKQVNIDFLLSLVSLYAAADRLCNIASLQLLARHRQTGLLVPPPRQLIRSLQTPAALTLNTLQRRSMLREIVQVQLK